MGGKMAICCIFRKRNKPDLKQNGERVNLD